MPIRMPQNTELNPKKLIPDAVAKNVINAESLCSSFFIAMVILAEMAPINARPASAATSSFGSKLNTITILPANKPPNK